MKRWLGPLVMVVLIVVLFMVAWPRPDVLINQDADGCEWGIFSSSTDIPRDALKATVNWVESGDTLSLDTLVDPDLPVRLYGIDAPEGGDPEGDNAADFLRQTLPEGTTVYTLSGSEARDDDGRTVLLIWKTSGELVNTSLLYSGSARASFTEANTARRAEFEAAEASAKDC